MTKKNPDKREQKRLKKIEDGKQQKRYDAARYVKEGLSLRQAASKIGTSHIFVRIWRDRLLDCFESEYTMKGKTHAIKEYRFKSDWRELIKTRKPGPEPGNCPKADSIMDAVVAQKNKPFRKNIGAFKIGLMADVDASGPTVSKALKKAGYGIVTKPAKKHTKRVCRPVSNDQFNIDLVELGKDSETGKTVEYLSIEDDHSRFVFEQAPTVNATTDYVIAALEKVFETAGIPRRIRSDHGVQWYATRGGNSRFDMMCDGLGIRHDMAGIRTPEENGKVERFHGSIRKEAGLPDRASLDEYDRIMREYRDFYNNERPHCSLGYRTPERVYNKTYYQETFSTFRA